MKCFSDCVIYFIDTSRPDDVLQILGFHPPNERRRYDAQITSLTIVYSTIYSGADQRKYQSSASLAFVRGIHRGPVNSPHERASNAENVPFDDVIMSTVKLGTYTKNSWSSRLDGVDLICYVLIN